MRRFSFAPVARLVRGVLKGWVSWALRVLYRVGRPSRFAQSGFVLPVTALLLIFLVLTAVALTYRSFSRSEEVIAQREQQVIVNAATPAIDRAKAKLEYLFGRQSDLPPLPSSDQVAEYLSRDDYTLPDETRIDIDGDGTIRATEVDANLLGTSFDLADNAWVFPSDIDGDGEIEDGELVAYSMVVDDATDSVTLTESNAETKANALVTRTGPANTAETSAQCRQQRAPGGGWQLVNQSSTSAVQKNFQVNVLALNQNDVNRTVEALEFQQSREAFRGNKWGAYFKYDIEWHPGPTFNWNGAMHTDGSLFVRNDVETHMISSHNSCLYEPASSSEITLGGIREPEADRTDFVGQLVLGTIKNNNFTSGSGSSGNRPPTFHVYDGAGVRPDLNWDLTVTTDSVRKATGDDNNDFVANDTGVSDIGMDPIKLFTEGEADYVDASTWAEDGDFTDEDVYTGERIFNRPEIPPFVDDFYRADDRWGPKPKYTEQIAMAEKLAVSGNTIVSGGQVTEGEFLELTDDTEGLDGYWERQAKDNGLRIVVGQRLELGNVYGWNFDPIAKFSSTENGFGKTAPIGPTTSGDSDDAFIGADPLYPPTPLREGNTGGDKDAGGPNEVRQRRTLRDNLAAVQGMVVYHYEGGGQATDGEFPISCIAVTAHPGTPETVYNSRNFLARPIADAAVQNKPYVNFLRGKGTDGWEFEYSDNLGSSALFELRSRFSTQALRKALTNLAYFAGDPDGGAPSFPTEQGKNGVVHPFPYLSMWGDYAILRNILDENPVPTRFGIASGSTAHLNNLADLTTIHSATCTLQLLAYTLDSLQDDFDAIVTDPSSQEYLRKVGNKLLNIDIPGSFEIDNANTVADRTANEWLAELVDDYGADDPDVIQAEIIADHVQAMRDRTFGFADAPAIPDFIGDSDVADNLPGTYDNVAGTFTLTADIPNPGLGGDFLSGTTYDLTCNPEYFNTASAAAAASDSADERQARALAIALALCPKGETLDASEVNLESNEVPVYAPKYPSLYYLFPVFDHAQQADVDTTAALGADYDVAQPTAEEFIDRTTGTAVATATDPGRTPITHTYQSFSASDISDFAAVPRDPGTDLLADNWVLPYASAATAYPEPIFGTDITNTGGADYDSVDAPNDPDLRFTINAPDGNGYDVTFLDKVLFDPRENMAVRVLDMNLENLTTNTNPNGTDYWVGDDFEDDSRGVVFTFREDAVREDAIVRPYSTTFISDAAAWDSCNELSELTGTTACKMSPDENRDPPVNFGDGTTISTKPVDFYPDPDRRPYGFRLINGADISNALDRENGFTMVTDNPVYILGDFNLHSDDGENANLEEFIETLNDDFVDYGVEFYNARETSNVPNFANVDVDHWRPVEILSDSMNILSEGFRDGTVQDTYLRETANDSNVAFTSFMNQNRPYDTDYSALHSFILENGDLTLTNAANNSQEWDTITAPLWVDRNGVYRRKSGSKGTYNNGSDSFACSINRDNTGPRLVGCGSGGNPGGYIGYHLSLTDLTNRRKYNMIRVNNPIHVNSLFVTGIVPSRANQGYGGLHNYPRLLEDWEAGSSSNPTNLFISGSFLQFDFSTYATGPYDLDSWEPTQDPINDEYNVSYRAAGRRWGYDVALQYQPPGPVAERFVNRGEPRNEYYRELPIDDPYIGLLRCANVDGAPFDPDADCD